MSRHYVERWRSSVNAASQKAVAGLGTHRVMSADRLWQDGQAQPFQAMSQHRLIATGIAAWVAVCIQNYLPVVGAQPLGNPTLKMPS